MLDFSQRSVFTLLFAALLIFPQAVSLAYGADEPVAPPAEALTEMNLEELMQVTVYGASKFEQPISEAPSSVSSIPLLLAASTAMARSSSFP